LQEIEQEKINTYNRATSIIADATNQAYRKKETIEAEANLNAKKIRNDAELDIEKMRIQMKTNIQKQVVDIAFSAAETLVKKKYTSKEDYKTINEFIKELNKKDPHE
jgi:F-type H+-transporting ATPase subunit b